MDKKLPRQSLVLYLSLSIFTSMSYAEEFRTPIFSGEWYETAIQNDPNAYKNSCHETVNTNYLLFHHTISAEKTAISLADELHTSKFGIPPKECKVSSISPDISSDFKPPETFPIRELWYITSNTHGNPQRMTAHVSCTHDSMYWYGYSISDISPHYKSCEDNECFEICNADVPGRDFAVPYPLDAYGHIAIGMLSVYELMPEPQYGVLEVLWEEPVIQINTIDDFRLRSKYWGARYNVDDLRTEDNNITLDQAKAVYNVAAEQMRYCPEYVFLALRTRPGSPNTRKVYDKKQEKWISQLAVECARFRCDTFVNYAYKEALSVTLPDPARYPKPIIPIDTFYSMKYQRPVLKKATYDRDYYLSLYGSESDILFFKEVTEKMQELSSKEALDYAVKYYNQNRNEYAEEVLLMVFEKIEMDNRLSPQQRANLYLNIIDKYKNNTKLIEIITNNFNSNIDLSQRLDEVLKLFNRYKNNTIIRKHIIAGLANTYSDYLAGKTDNDSIEKITIIQAFFVEQVKNPQEGELVTLLGYLPAVLPTEEIQESLNSIDYDKLTETEITQIHRQQALVSFNFLLKSPKKWEDFWIPFSIEQRKAIALMMTEYLAESNFTDRFDSQQKAMINQYLQTYWPSSFKRDANFTFNFQYWLTALENTAPQVEDKTTFVFCVLLKHPVSAEAAFYINHGNYYNKPIKDSACKRQIIDIFKQGFYNENASREDRAAFAAALTTLGVDLNRKPVSIGLVPPPI